MGRIVSLPLECLFHRNIITRNSLDLICPIPPSAKGVTCTIPIVYSRLSLNRKRLLLCIEGTIKICFLSMRETFWRGYLAFLCVHVGLMAISCAACCITCLFLLHSLSIRSEISSDTRDRTFMRSLLLCPLSLNNRTKIPTRRPRSAVMRVQL